MDAPGKFWLRTRMPPYSSGDGEAMVHGNRERLAPLLMTGINVIYKKMPRPGYLQDIQDLWQLTGRLCPQDVEECSQAQA